MIGWPVMASQTRAEPSAQAVANRFPPGSNAAWLTPLPSSTVTAELPVVVTSQSRAVESEPTVNTLRAIRREPGEQQRSAVEERRRERLSGRRIPDPGNTIDSRRRDPAAVGAEARIADGDRVPHRARCRRDRPAGLGIPDPAVPSWLAVTTRRPSGLNSAWKTHLAVPELGRDGLRPS